MCAVGQHILQELATLAQGKHACQEASMCCRG